MAGAFERTRFTIIDYTVFGSTLLICLGIGIFFAVFKGGQRTSGQYLMGSRQLKLIPVTLSILVTFVSSTGILGTPAEMFFYGTGFSMCIFGMCLGCIYSAILFVPLYYPLKLTSTFEYFQLRFRSTHCQVFGSVLSIFTSIFVSGVGLYAPSVALNAVSGVPVWFSTVAAGLISTLYTTIGGMTAVVWTDVFQAVVLFAGLITVVVLGVIEVGGVQEVWRLNQEWDRIQFIDFNPDPTLRSSVWSTVIFMSVLWMSLGVMQPTVQRYCSLPKMRLAQVSLLLNIPCFALTIFLTSAAGVVAFAYYAKIGCDPLSQKVIDNPNQILPYFVADVAGYPGISGLFIACLYSASLSTASSTYNAVAALVFEDFLKPCMPNLSDSKKTAINKVTVVLCGFVCIGVAMISQFLGGTFIQILYSVCGAVMGPMVGMFCLAAFVPKAGKGGAIIGGYVSLIFSLWLAVGGYKLGYHETPLPLPNKNCTSLNQTDTFNLPFSPVNFTEVMNSSTSVPQVKSLEGVDYLYAISCFWYPMIGITIVMIVGTLTICIPGLKASKRVPIKYISPLIRSCLCHPCCNADKVDLEDVLQVNYSEDIENSQKSRHMVELPEANVLADVNKSPLLKKHWDETQAKQRQSGGNYSQSLSKQSSLRSQNAQRASLNRSTNKQNHNTTIDSSDNDEDYNQYYTQCATMIVK